MGFYFRKSVGLGRLFRINFSKSGLSYSVGVKGARVNFGNRGTYVNIGSHGLYYRKKVSGFDNSPPSNNNYDIVPSESPEDIITSGNVEAITDNDSQDFIHELTSKANKSLYSNWLGYFPLVISLTALLYFFFSPKAETVNKSTPVSETKYFIKSLSSSRINIRASASNNGKILGSFFNDEQYPLRNENNDNWYAIQFNDKEGFVSKKVTQKIGVDSIYSEIVPTSITTNLFEKQSSLFLTYLISIVVFFIVIIVWLTRVDKRRLLIEIHYDIDSNIKSVYEKFVSDFSGLLKSARVWQYRSSSLTHDYKYTSGAYSSVDRRTLSRISINKAPTRFFETNIQIPYLGLINTELYFFPERLIIKRGDKFGGIMYKHIDATSDTTRFIEKSGVPSDAIVVDKTWRYLNKNGTPDRRFNNNYQIPICNYSEYMFHSSSGLNEKISTSKRGCLDEFIQQIKVIGELQNHFANNEKDKVTSDEKILPANNE